MVSTRPNKHQNVGDQKRRTSTVYRGDFLGVIDHYIYFLPTWLPSSSLLYLFKKIPHFLEFICNSSISPWVSVWWKWKMLSAGIWAVSTGMVLTYLHKNYIDSLDSKLVEVYQPPASSR